MSLALKGVAGEQGWIGQPLQHEPELPTQIVGITQAAIQTLPAKRRHQVSGVTQQKDPALLEIPGHSGVEGVNGGASDGRLRRPAHRLKKAAPTFMTAG